MSATPYDASPAGAEAVYVNRAPDLTSLSARLGTATQEEVRALTGSLSAVDLVHLGNDCTSAAVLADALQILGTAADFFDRAPGHDLDAVYVTEEVVRVGAWAAAEGERALAALRAATPLVGDTPETQQALAALEMARAEARKLAELVRTVGQRASTEDAVRRALAPHTRGDVGAGLAHPIAVLVDEGRGLMNDPDPDVRHRAGFYRLTPERLRHAEEVAAKAVEAAKLLGIAHSTASQELVDWWDGATFVILRSLVRAFQGARATHPAVPALDFVAIRARAAPRA